MSVDISHRGLQLLPDMTSETLHTLKADHNSLSGVSRLPYSLKVLDLAYNKLTFVEALDSLTPDLRELDISFNRLITLEGITSLGKLERLCLAHNFIGDDQVNDLANLKALKSLDISHNHLRDASLMTLLASLQRLQVLVNASNDFTIAVFDFPMPHLLQLVFDSNKLKLLQFDQEMKQLQVLSACNNFIQKVEGLVNLKELTELYLDNNQIMEVPAELNLLHSLRVCSLKNNKVYRVENLVSPTLEVLDLANNFVHTITETYLPSLQELYLDNNRLTQLPLDSPQLKKLHIPNNCIKSLRFLRNFPMLELVLTTGNPLETEFSCAEQYEFKEQYGLSSDIESSSIDIQDSRQKSFGSVLEAKERNLVERIRKLEEVTKKIREKPARRSSHNKKCRRKPPKGNFDRVDHGTSIQHSFLVDSLTAVKPNFEKLIISALAPPKPILANECYTPLEQTLHPRSFEYQELSRLFAPRTLGFASKTYTYSLVQAFKQAKRKNVNETFNDLDSTQVLMFVGSSADFTEVARSPSGFGVLKPPFKFTSFFTDSGSALVSLVHAPGNTAVIHRSSLALPVYQVTITN